MLPSSPDKLPNSREYWNLVRARARRLGSDGCSGPAMEIYQDACFEHDIHYAFHAWVSGSEITRAEADKVFRWRIQQMWPWRNWPKRKWMRRVLSPAVRLAGQAVSWWRWAAVRYWPGAQREWDKHKGLQTRNRK